jgi:light-harvesting complex 1 alpha chain
VQLL